ncbi:hypothetical protein ACFE04_006728 [Oxalis oulophora]
MAQVINDHQKWEGKAYAEVTGIKTEQVWLYLQDFGGLNKWFPTLTTCLLIQGISGEPGCVRYCSGFKTPADKDKRTTSDINWTKQKLLSINPSEYTFTYSIIDGNVGFNGYVSTVSLLPKKEDDDGCVTVIEWKYEVEPVQGWRLEDLDRFIGNGLQVMAKRMEETTK